MSYRPATACPVRAWCALGVLTGAAAPAATLVINVHAPDGHAVPGAVVTARPLDAPVTQARRDACGHGPGKPRVRARSAGHPGRLHGDFPNSDSVSHQIYSFSPAKRFQLPLYHGTPYPPVHFDQAGVVTLGCNIHDEMLAYLLVTDAPYYGRTDATGTWTAEVPRGHYRVSIWHPRLRDNDATSSASSRCATPIAPSSRSAW